MSNYRIREKAKQDLFNIWQHSSKGWGKLHAKKYMEGLRKALLIIGDNPKLGHNVKDYPGFRVMSHGAHLVFYIIAPDGVPEIVRIPDSRQDRETISPSLYELPE